MTDLADDAPQQPPQGLRGDLARLFSEKGLHEGRPSVAAPSSAC